MVRNGTNRCGNAQYHCKACGTYRVLKPKQAYSEAEKATVLRAGLERCSLRGVERIFGWMRGMQGYVLFFPSVQKLRTAECGRLRRGKEPEESTTR